MAKIPESSLPLLGQSVNQTSPGPTSSATYKVLSSIGGAAAEFALESLSQMKRTQDNAWSTNQASRYQLDLLKQTNETKLKYGDSPFGYSSFIQDASGSLAAKYEKDSPSRDAVNLYRQKISGISLESQLQAETYEFSESIKYYDREDERRVNEMSKSLMEAPNFSTLQTYYTQEREYLKEGLGSQHNETLYKAKLSRAKRALALGYMNALDLQGKSASSYKEYVGFYSNMLSFLQGGGDFKVDEAAKTDIEYVEMTFDEARDFGYSEQEIATQTAKGNTTYRVPKGVHIQMQSLDINSRNELIEGLTPEEKKAWLQTAYRGIKQKDRASISKLNQHVNDFKAKAWSSRVDNAELDGIRLELDSSPLDLETKARVHNDINIATVFGIAKDRLYTSPRSELTQANDILKQQLKIQNEAFAISHPELADIMSKSYFNARSNVQLERSVEKLKSDIIHAQDSDSALYAQVVDPNISKLKTQSVTPGGMQRYLNSLQAFYDRVGITPQNQRIVSKEDSKGIGYAMEKLTPDQTAKQLIQYENLYGNKFSDFLDTLIKDNSLNEGYRFIAYMPSLETKTSLISNLKQETAINTNFKSIAGDETELRGYVADVAVDLSMAIKSGDTTGTVDSTLSGINKSISLEAKKEIARNPDIKYKDAVEKAYNRVFGGAFSITKGGKSTVAYRKVLNNAPVNDKLIETFLKKSIDKEYLKQLNPDAPTTIKNLAKTNGINVDEAVLDYLEDNSTWVSSPKMDRFFLFDPTTGTYWRNKSGKRIEKKISDINRDQYIIRKM